MSEKLRIGVMISASGTIEGWEAYILSHLARDSNIEWVAVIQHREAASGGAVFAKKLRTKWRRIPHVMGLRLMERIDQFIGRSQFVRVGGFGVDSRYPISKFLPGAPVVEVTPVESASGLVQRFDADTIDKIRSFQLDLLIRFGFKILKGEILSAARFGVLSYHHADNAVNRGGPAGFWEVYHDLKQTGSTLQVLTEELDGGLVARKGIYPTYRFSWHANKRRVRATSAWLMIDAIRELARDRKWVAFPDQHPLRVYANPLYTSPKLFQSMAHVGKLLWRISGHVSSRVFAIRQWRILFKISNPTSSPVPAPKDFALRKLAQLVPPPGRFFADPFLFIHDGKPFLFVEDFDRSTGKAKISWFEWSGKAWNSGGTALECNYHLSYPFVFEHGGKVFMIPESCGSRRIELWRADPFPTQWRLERVLMDGISAVDSTLLAKDGRLYLFTNVDRSGVGDHGTELHIFWTDDLLNGDWHAHRKNPVLQDCRVARNAGGFFVDAQGRLMRTAQINGFDYGEGLVLREVKHLSECEYEEETRETIQPSWEPNIVGLHHANVAGASIVLDSCHRVPRFRGMNGKRS